MAIHCQSSRGPIYRARRIPIHDAVGTLCEQVRTSWRLRSGERVAPIPTATDAIKSGPYLSRNELREKDDGSGRCEEQYALIPANDGRETHVLHACIV